jgi:hypothetical protein
LSALTCAGDPRFITSPSTLCVEDL